MLTFPLPRFFLIFSPFLIANAQYLVEVLEETPFGGHTLIVRCDATGADFGPDILEFNFRVNAIGCATRVQPQDACGTTHIALSNGTLCVNFFAVVPRGNCSFSEKAYHVQRAHPDLHAIIIFNKEGESPIPMKGSEHAADVEIPAVMITHSCMLSIMDKYPAEEGYLVAIKVAPGYYDLVKYLIPFVAVVGFCFIILLVSLVIRLCRERRRVARKRLSRRNLRKIPTKKFKKGDEPETCAICLEDFVDGEKLRMLPCNHHYHCKCVDPWLTKNRKVCPVCKRKVGARQGDSDSSDEERRADAAAGRSRENAPLLHNEQPVGTSSPSTVPYPNYRAVAAPDGETVGSMVLSPSGSPHRVGEPWSRDAPGGAATRDDRGLTTVRAVVHSSSETSRDAHGPISTMDDNRDSRTSSSDDDAMMNEPGEGDRSSTVSQSLKDRLRPFVQGLIGRRRANNGERQPLTDLVQVDDGIVRGEDNAGFESPTGTHQIRLSPVTRPQPSTSASRAECKEEADDGLADVEQAGGEEHETSGETARARKKSLKSRSTRNQQAGTIASVSGSRPTETHATASRLPPSIGVNEGSNGQQVGNPTGEQPAAEEHDEGQ